MPMLTTKKFWGSKYGTIGSWIGIVLGMFGGWIWILVGPFLWALLGEYYKEKKIKNSLRPAIGSFLGIFVSGILKLGISFMMIFYFIKQSLVLFS